MVKIARELETFGLQARAPLVRGWLKGGIEIRQVGACGSWGVRVDQSDRYVDFPVYIVYMEIKQPHTANLPRKPLKLGNFCVDLRADLRLHTTRYWDFGHFWGSTI